MNLWFSKDLYMLSVSSCLNDDGKSANQVEARTAEKRSEKKLVRWLIAIPPLQDVSSG